MSDHEDLTIGATASIEMELDQRRTTAAAAVFVNETPCSPEPITLSIPADATAELGNPERIRVTVEVACRECGCVDSEACFGGCSWVEPGLCSTCQPRGMEVVPTDPNPVIATHTHTTATGHPARPVADQGDAEPDTATAIREDVITTLLATKLQVRGLRPELVDEPEFRRMVEPTADAVLSIGAIERAVRVRSDKRLEEAAGEVDRVTRIADGWRDRALAAEEQLREAKGDG